MAERELIERAVHAWQPSEPSFDDLRRRRDRKRRHARIRALVLSFVVTAASLGLVAKAFSDRSEQPATGPALPCDQPAGAVYDGGGPSPYHSPKAAVLATLPNEAWAWTEYGASPPPLASIPRSALVVTDRHRVAEGVEATVFVRIGDTYPLKYTVERSFIVGGQPIPHKDAGWQVPYVYACPPGTS
jgi:hypothetical protein